MEEHLARERWYLEKEYSTLPGWEYEANLAMKYRNPGLEEVKLKWWRGSTILATVLFSISLLLWILGILAYVTSTSDGGSSGGNWCWAMLVFSSLLFAAALLIPPMVDRGKS